MEAKLFLLFVTLASCYLVADALECYTCSSINNYQYDLGLADASCENFTDDSVSTVASSYDCESCSKVDMVIGYRVQLPDGSWESAEERVVDRECQYLSHEDECKDIEDILDKNTLAREIEDRTSIYGHYNVQVTKLTGEACGCNSDLCNTATTNVASFMSFVALMVIVKFIF